jgi:hypothetical protein
VHSGAVDRVDGNRCRDELGESMRPFGLEEEVVAGAPDDEGGCCECGQPGSDRGEVVLVELGWGNGTAVTLLSAPVASVS